MSVLSNIPPQAVLPLNAYNLKELRKSAEYSEQTFLHALCTDCKDKESVLAEIANSFGFASHFGQNLDALYDCITDLEPDSKADRPGFVVVLEGLPDTDKFDASLRNRVLDVFRDAADFFDDQNTAFRVFYSVARRDAPKN